MSPDTLNFHCEARHGGTDHQIIDRIYPGEEPTECQDYHRDDKAPHANSNVGETLNTHTKYVAYQTCHIPAFTRGQATRMTQFPPVDPTPEATEEAAPAPTEEPAPVEEQPEPEPTQAPRGLSGSSTLWIVLIVIMVLVVVAYFAIVERNRHKTKPACKKNRTGQARSCFFIFS